MADGARLVGRAPHVGPDAWLHVLPPSLSRAQTSELERRLGASLPESYRQLLQGFANGLGLFSDSLSLYGLRTDSSRTLAAAFQPHDLMLPNGQERPAGVPGQWLFVGSWSLDGSLAVIDAEERLLRCDADTAEILGSWPAVGPMVASEAERLAGLFDEQGRKRNDDEPTTPPRD